MSNNIDHQQSEDNISCKRIVVTFNGLVMDDDKISWGVVHNLRQWDTLCSIVNPRFQVMQDNDVVSESVFEDISFYDDQEWMLFTLPKETKPDTFFIGHYMPSDEMDVVGLTAMSSTEFYRKTETDETVHAPMHTDNNDRYATLIPCPRVNVLSKFRLHVGGNRTLDPIQIQ